jgi:hypothetical protein
MITTSVGKVGGISSNESAALPCLAAACFSKVATATG